VVSNCVRFFTAPLRALSPVRVELSLFGYEVSWPSAASSERQVECFLLSAPNLHPAWVSFDEALQTLA
jgi:hypothetical protein